MFVSVFTTQKKPKKKQKKIVLIKYKSFKKKGQQKKMTNEFLLHKSSFQSIGIRKTQEDKFKIMFPFANQTNLILLIVCDGHFGLAATDFLINRFPILLETFITKCKTSGVTKYTTFMNQALQVCVEEWDYKCFGDKLYTINDQASKELFFLNRDVTRWRDLELESGCTICSILIDLTERKLHSLNLGDSKYS